VISKEIFCQCNFLIKEVIGIGQIFLMAIVIQCSKNFELIRSNCHHIHNGDGMPMFPFNKNLVQDKPSFSHNIFNINSMYKEQIA
jgi:hypothetical protein